MGMMHAPTSQDDTTRSKTILIVDDDVAIGDFLVQAISGETPYHALAVQDGFAALKTVRTITPDLILLDYLLPGMDGLECVDLLRASQDLEHTPIILMSARLPRHARERTDLFLLEKPFELEEFLQRLKQILEAEHVSFSKHAAQTNREPQHPEHTRYLRAMPHEETQ